MSYPLRHISICVPWHDMSGKGRVCAAPRLNGSCLKLKRIAEDRDDAAVAGKRLDELAQAQWPACAAERMGGQNLRGRREHPLDQRYPPWRVGLIDCFLAALEAVLASNRELELLVLKLRRERLGRHTERLDPRQIALLFDALMAQGTTPEPVDPDAEAREDAALDQEMLGNALDLPDVRFRFAHLNVQLHSEVGYELMKLERSRLYVKHSGWRAAPSKARTGYPARERG
jgi:hypothetical protein